MITMKPLSKNKVRNNKFSVLNNTLSTIKESRSQISEVSKADESLAAEQIIAILIRNHNLNGFEVKKEMEKPIEEMSDDFKFIFEFFTSISKTPIKDKNEIILTTQRAVTKIKSFGLPIDADQYGTEKEMPTEDWVNKYGGESQKIMPKTDVLNGEKHHSVKQRGPVQVLDSSQKQVGALCLYAMEQTKENHTNEVINLTKKQVSEMQSIVSKLSRIPDEEKYKNFADDYKKQNPKAKSKEIRDAAKKQNLITSGGDIRSGNVTLSVNAKKQLEEFESKILNLNKIIETIFSNINTNDEFKRIFLTESMSGDVMFGKKLASANSIMTWERNFKNIDLMSVSYAVEEILPVFTPPKFETKSSGNWMTTVGKIPVDLSKFEKESDIRARPQERGLPTFESVLKENFGDRKPKRIEEMISFIGYGKSVVESYNRKVKSLKESLSEGVLTEESFFEKVKIIFKSMVNAVQIIGERLSNYFSDLKDALYGSMTDLFDFFDLKIIPEPGYQVKVKF